ncbi:TonB-dependent receptor [Sphingobacterium oryzagri]|uniref:TonB-dependent receptor n=1 Tax=Sphingobacterium oryzagri TaxID=3025669 RepID=A0ABY7WGA0_9SPHI|nr:TonB-dependent receptor [Sphingobacterium sp. KACC 22765]WDF68641.1 TonB-dependent receptor [Sphingobacterium sp. KACC 22765]
MKNIILIVASLFTACLASFAQGTVSRTIQGEVMNEDNEPLSGVTIYEKKHATRGTSTDNNGKFTLRIEADAGEVLVVRYVGYFQKEVPINARTSTISIVLQKDLSGIEEVVVIGFGQQSRATLTGAVSTISGEAINQSPSASLQNNLMGRLPGFLSQQTSGRPGQDGARFQIRGVNTMALGTTSESFIQATSPLIIIDDVEFTYDQLSQIDPNEIESLSLLKDASTTAVYGVRGANGVLIIKTKRGQTGRPAFSVSNETGITMNTEAFRNNGVYETLSLLRETSYNRGLNPTTEYPRFFGGDNFQNYVTNADPYAYPYVDWWSELMKPYSRMNTSSFNVTGGSERARYNVTAGYYTQGGTYKNFSQGQGYNNDYFANRYTFRSNLDFSPSQSTKVRFDISGRFQTVNGPYDFGWNSGATTFGTLWGGAQSSFGYPVYNANGTYGGPAPGVSTQPNPVANLTLSGYDRSQTNNISAVMELRQDLEFITPGLNFRGLVSYASDYVYNTNLRRAPGTIATFYLDPVTGSYVPATSATLFRTGPLARTGGLSSFGSLLSTQFSLNYDKSIGDHNISIMGMINDNTNTASYTSSSTVLSRDPYSVRGITARIQYDFAKKYIINVNGGYNGSTRFGEGDRYQLFPALSVAWNIDQENFMKSLHFIDVWKIRASYGFTGSDGGTGGVYNYEQVYVPGSGDGYNFGEVPTSNVAGTLEPRLPNQVSWEVQRDFNLGTDITLFNGKFTATADYFIRYRDDILIERVSVPSTIGVALPQVNLGRMSNRGYEVEATYRDANSTGFGWSVSGQVTYTRNRIEFMDEGVQRFPWLGNTGRSTGGMFGYVTDGYLSSIEEVYNLPLMPNQTPMVNTFVGDLKYVDLNGDGIIDLYDQRYLGSDYAPMVTGLTLSFSYKGFDLTTLLQGRFGGLMRINRGTLSYEFPDRNSAPFNLGRWTPILGDDATMPVLGGSTIRASTDFWVASSDYLRWKMIEFGYTFSKNWTQRFKVNNLRLYCNGYNMALLYTGISVPVDPEALSGTGSEYPQQRIFNIGLRLGF